MSSVQPTTPAASPAQGAPPPPAGPAADPQPLLPEPTSSALPGADPLSMLYYFESRDQEMGAASGTQRIQSLETDRHQALAEEQQAIQKAIDASRNRSFWDNLGGIFGEVAKVAAVVASIAAAVVSCGAATPIAALAIGGAILSSASFADSHLHVLQSLGVDASTAGLIDTGLEVAGAVCTFGAGVTGGAASSLVSRTSIVVSGVSLAAHGATTIAAAQARADSDRAEADEIVDQATSDHASRAIQGVVDEAQGEDDRSRAALQTIANTKGIQIQTTAAAAAGVKG